MENIQYILKRFVFLAPILINLNLLLVCLYENIYNVRISDALAQNLGLYFGSSWSTFWICIVLFFAIPKNDPFCTFTKINVIAMGANLLMFEIGRFIPYEFYQKWVTVIVFSLVFITFLFYSYRNKKE